MTDEQSKNSRQNPDAMEILDPKIDLLVGDKLRSYFDNLITTSVPDRIVELVMALRAKEQKERGDNH